MNGLVKKKKEKNFTFCNLLLGKDTCARPLTE